MIVGVGVVRSVTTDMSKLHITYPHMRTGHIRVSHVMNGEHPWSRALLSWQKGRPQSRVCWRVRNAKKPPTEYNRHKENNKLAK